MRIIEDVMRKSAYIAFSALLVACTTNLYEEKTDPGNPNGGNTLPEGSNFSTITETTLTVSVDDEYNGKYTYGVEVYGENPLLVEDAKPLYAGIAKGNEPLVMDIEIPQAAQQIYVLQKDPTKGKTVATIAVTEGQANISCDFRPRTITNKSALRAAETKGNEVIVDTEDPFIFEADGYEFKSQGTESLTHVIASGDVLEAKNLSVDKNAILRVEGALICDEMTVKDGGALTNMKNVTIRKKLIIEAGGTLENNCHILVDEFQSKNGSQVLLGASTLFKSRKINSTGTTYSLSEYAILRTTEPADFSKGNNEIQGVGEFCGLLDFSSLEAPASADELLTIRGNIQLLNRGVLWIGSPKSLAMEDPATMVNLNASVNIPAGECTGEGHVVEKPAPDNVYMDEIPNGGLFTFAMEDNWPSLGDYDMNDLVLGVRSTLVPAANSSDIQQMKLVIYLRAVGGTKKLGAGIQFDAVASSEIGGVRGEAVGSDLFTVGSNQVEEGDRAVLPLFDNAHSYFNRPNQITNTIDENSPMRILTYDISFKTPVSQAKLRISQLNFFIVNGGDATNRSEVHLAGYKPTSKVKGEASYWSGDGMMWGILVPGNFKYPRETSRITDAYPGFKEWSQSGRNKNKDWYTTPNEKLVIPIFQEEDFEKIK